MKKNEFAKLLKDVYLYFGYKTSPGKEQAESWYEEISHIPLTSLEWIEAELKQGGNLPRNLPQKLKQLWIEYLLAHPKETVFDDDSHNCQECHGNGFLHFRKLNESFGYNYEYVAVCAQCGQGRKRFGSTLLAGGRIATKQENGSWIYGGANIPHMLRSTQAQIIENGWEFVKAEDPYQPKVGDEDEIPSYGPKRIEHITDTERETRIAELKQQGELLTQTTRTP